MDGNNIDIMQAIRNFSRGETKEFNQLISFLKNDQISGEILASHLTQLAQCILFINKEHETLIGVILNINWTSYKSPIPEKYLAFISDLVSAKSYYLNVCIKALMKTLVIRVDVSDDDVKKEVELQHEHIHKIIEAIRKLAPISEKYINQHIKSLFPYIGKPTYILQSYLINILRISSSSCKTTRYNILALVVDKLLSIDVRISKQELDQIASAEDNQQLQFEGDANFNSTLSESAYKLDQLLVVMFTYFHSLCHINNSLVYDEAEQLFHDILLIFNDVILKTQQSTHVQFIIFYVASFNKKFSELFLSTCWDILQNPNNAQVIRQAASAYLASFVARAKYLDKSFVKEQLRKLSDWVHRYLDNQDSGNLYADFYKHSPFYSTCQSLFYVFIYHHKYFLDTSEKREFIKSLNFMRIVTSKLNPLKYCLSTVVNLFARITRMHEIVFCYSVIEHNNRCALNELSFERNSTAAQNEEIEMFFPFDPYILPKSSLFIKSLFFEWNEDEIEDTSDEEHIPEDADSFTDDSITADSMVVSSSFDLMCISPGFHLGHQKFLS